MAAAPHGAGAGGGAQARWAWRALGAAMARSVPLLWVLLPGLAALEPLSVGLALGVASALTGYLSHPRFYCSYVECCPRAGQRLNASGTAGAGSGRAAPELGRSRQRGPGRAR